MLFLVLFSLPGRRILSERAFFLLLINPDIPFPKVKHLRTQMRWAGRKKKSEINEGAELDDPPMLSFEENSIKGEKQ